MLIILSSRTGFLIEGHFLQMSRQSPVSANIRGDNDGAGGCAQISWHLPYCREKPRKTSARRPSDECYATSQHLKCGLFSK